MLLLLYESSANIVSGAGTAAGQSSAAAQSISVFVPLGLLLLYEDKTGSIPSISSTVGTVNGLSSANATGAYGPFIFASKGTAAGVSSVNAISSTSAFIFSVVGISSGLSSANATGAYGPFVFASKGTAAGVSSVNAISTLAVFTFAKGTAAGSSTVEAFTGSTRPGDGLSFGQVTALGFSPAILGAIGFSKGQSFASARGELRSIAVGNHFLPASLKIEFSKDAFTLFTAVRINYKFYTSRVLDSSGIVVIDGETYTGRDPSHGTLMSLDIISDGTGDDAPAVRIVMLPPDPLNSWFMLDPAIQGAVVQVFIGAMEATTGSLLGYQQVFLGEVDISTLEVDSQMRSLTLDCVSVFERFFDDEEGVRLTDSWHQSVWPGEQGLIYVTDIERQIPWGQDAPTVPPVSTNSSSSTNYNFSLGGNGFGRIV